MICEEVSLAGRRRWENWRIPGVPHGAEKLPPKHVITRNFKKTRTLQDHSCPIDHDSNNRDNVNQMNGTSEKKD